MKIGKVIGRVVCHTIYQGLEGVPLLWVQPVHTSGAPKGAAIVAADQTKSAGHGELVAFEGGREAAMALDVTFVPVDHSIIAILDGIHVGEDSP